SPEPCGISMSHTITSTDVRANTSCACFMLYAVQTSRMPSFSHDTPACSPRTACISSSTNSTRYICCASLSADRQYHRDHRAARPAVLKRETISVGIEQFQAAPYVPYSDMPAFVRVQTALLLQPGQHFRRKPRTVVRDPDAQPARVPVIV